MLQVALFKLYKEYEDGAFSMFGSSGTANLESFVGGGDAVKGALKTYLDAQKQVSSLSLEGSQNARSSSVTTARSSCPVTQGEVCVGFKLCFGTSSSIILNWIVIML